MVFTSSYRKKMEEWEQWAREEKGTDETQGGGGCIIEGEGEWDSDGERHAWRVGRELLTERGVMAIAIAVVATAAVRAAEQKTS
jgi:hypothetical protein